MSATKTTKTASATVLDKVFLPFAKRLGREADRLRRTEGTMLAVQLAIGADILKASKAMLDKGASVDEVQDRIVKATSYPWSSLETFERAAAVVGTLPEHLRNRFAAESLRHLGRVPEADGQRAALAERLAKANTVGIRAVREAVSENRAAAKPKTGKPKGKPAAGTADALVAKYRKQGDEVDIADAVAVATFGILVATGRKPSKAIALALDTLLYRGPVATDDGVDIPGEVLPGEVK